MIPSKMMIHADRLRMISLKVIGTEKSGGSGGWLLFEDGFDRGDRCLFAF
jgi:hypothetical protein